MLKNLKYIPVMQIFFTIFALKFSLTKGFASDGAANTPESIKNVIFECTLPNFDSKSYSMAVSAMFKAYEDRSKNKIKPGKKGRVGLKVYTNSGPGLATPIALVDAVIEQLLRRGYKKTDITIVDMSRRRLRESLYLPKLSALQTGTKDDYHGVNVADIESNKFFDKKWYYDNPLMPKSVRGAKVVDLYNPELRKSYLPIPLFLSVDFWINLPVVTDMEGLGVCAAIGNASIWNMSNNERFLKQPSNASMAAAEVCAIPELRDSNIFTILSYEKGQFVGGALFNSRCTFSENTIYLSANPVVLDYISWMTLNKYRRSFGFSPIDPMPALLNYCRELNIGEWDTRKVRHQIIPLPKIGIGAAHE